MYICINVGESVLNFFRFYSDISRNWASNVHPCRTATPAGCCLNKHFI